MEIEQFSRDFVTLPFDEHDNIVALDMIRSMSFVPSLGLGRHQHGPEEFIATIDQDTPFNLGFVLIEFDYIYMVFFHKERLKVCLLHISFDYSIHPYKTNLVDHSMIRLEVQSCLERITNGLNVD